MLAAPWPAESLAAFRIGVGLVLAWHFAGDLFSGRMNLAYVVPRFYFKFPGFEWVEPLSATGMQVLYVTLVLLSLAVAAGFCYRAAALLLFAGHTYTFLIDVARYQNHLYLTSLVCALLVFVPAHRVASVDGRLRRGIAGSVVPASSVLILRFQLAIVYFFGGIAKLDADWLLRAQPLRIWFSQQPPGTLRMPFMDTAFFAYFVSWGGLVFDLAIAPLLLWRRTRLWALAAATLFHLANQQLFNIGFFPWFMIVANLIFLPADWPSRLRRRLVHREVANHRATGSATATPIPRSSMAVTLLVVGYALVQLALPLRHWVYPGPVSWTEEGHRYSWRMKLRHKEGRVGFLSHDRSTGESTYFDPATVLTPYQLRKMTHDPALIAQLARSIGDGLRNQGQQRPIVTVDSRIALNGRPPQALIEPRWNLAESADSWLLPAPWIVPLRAPPQTVR